MTDKATKFFTHPIVIVLGALLCTALWGSATPAIKIGYEHILPVRDVPSTILFAGVRFFFAGVITVIIYSIAKRRVLYPKPANIGRIMVVGAFQTILQYVFFYIGLANTTGVKGTIASGASAFFILLISAFIFRQERFTLKKLIAVLLGFSGIVVANLAGLTLDMNLIGDGFVILSTIFYAFSTLFVKRFSQYEDTVVISGYQFIFGGAVMVIIGLVSGGRIVLGSVTAVAILVYLSFLSAIAYALWGLLIKYNTVSKIAVFSFMTPVFGVVLSEIFMPGEGQVKPLNLVFALLLVSLGIFMLNYQPYKKAEKEQDGK